MPVKDKKLIGVNIHMRPLNKIERTQLIDWVAKIKKIQSGWLLNAFEEFFEDGVAYKPVSLKEFLVTLSDWLESQNHLFLYIFVEPGEEDAMVEMGNPLSEPKYISIRQLRGLGEQLVRMTNHYLISDTKEILWVIVLCHEQDVHVCGSPDFIHSIRKLFQ